jgi:hypothetical protein
VKLTNRTDTGILAPVMFHTNTNRAPTFVMTRMYGKHQSTQELKERNGEIKKRKRKIME